MPSSPSYLHTDFDADEAYLIIRFLDEIKDLLWAIYGSEIIERHRCYTQHDTDDGSAHQTVEDFVDPPF